MSRSTFPPGPSAPGRSLARRLAGCGLAFALTGGLAAAEEETLIFTSVRQPNWDLYLFEDASAPAVRITDDPTLDFNPALSPDGRWVVFTSFRAGDPDLWAIDLGAPGAAPRLRTPVRLTDGVGFEDAAAFSPDGGTLVFVGSAAGGADLYAMPFRPGDLGTFAEARNLTAGRGESYRPAFSPDGSRIAYSGVRDAPVPGGRVESLQDGALHRLYVMNADGSGERRLSRTDGYEGSPVWSADGRSLVAYRAATRTGGPAVVAIDTAGIWRTPLDGAPAERLSPADAVDLSPALGLGGRLLSVRRLEERWRLVVHGEGGGVLPAAEGDGPGLELFGVAAHPASGRLVAFGPGPRAAGGTVEGPGGGPVPVIVEGEAHAALPDRRLRLRPLRLPFPARSNGALVGSLLARDSLLLLDSRTGDLRHLPVPGGPFPRFGTAATPDGSWIAYSAGVPFAPPDAPGDVWRVRPDGGGAENLTADSPANDALPDFSPDGRRIVFRSGRDGNPEIYLMDADGGNPRRLTDHPATDTMPRFAPDGRQIAFVSARDGDHEIYTLDLEEDGSPGRLRRRTRSPGFDTHPAYSPDGEWLVYSSARGGFGDEAVRSWMHFGPQPYGDLYAQRLADGAVVRLTHDRWEDGLALWVAAVEAGDTAEE